MLLKLVLHYKDQCVLCLEEKLSKALVWEALVNPYKVKAPLCRAQKCSVGDALMPASSLMDQSWTGAPRHG